MSCRRFRRLCAAVLLAGAGSAAAGCLVAHASVVTFGYGNARLGATPPQAITPPVALVSRLAMRWRARVGGAVNGQPIAVDGVRIGHRRLDLLLVGTEHGQVLALNARTGVVIWRRELGERTITPDCQATTDGVFGVTGTLVVDRAAGRAYAVDVNGRAWALRLGSGKSVAGWPVRTRSDPADFVWGALALSHGWLYFGVASVCDTGYYHGGILAINTRDPKLGGGARR